MYGPDVYEPGAYGPDTYRPDGYSPEFDGPAPRTFTPAADRVVQSLLDGVWQTNYTSVTGHLVAGQVRTTAGGGAILGGEGTLRDVRLERTARGDVVYNARWTMNGFAGTLRWSVRDGARPGDPPRFAGDWRLTGGPPGNWRRTGSWSGTFVGPASAVPPDGRATILAEPAGASPGPGRPTFRVAPR